MKKRVKLMATLMMVIMMMFVVTENVSAATHSWSVTKTPGVTSASDSVQIPLYKGQITYTVTKLSGTCSYLAGKCATPSDRYCYINTTDHCVLISKVNGSQSFYMAFTEAGLEREYMYFSCSIAHNAGATQLLMAEGTLSY